MNTINFVHCFCNYEVCRISFGLRTISYETFFAQPMPKAPPKPTDSELEILQVLWQHGPATVRTVNEQLSQHREVGYTTTLKIMQLMLEKGLVQRDDEGRSHIYRAAVREQDTQGLLLDKFVAATFGGSALKLVMQALGNRKTSPDELAQIRRLLNDIEIKNANPSTATPNDDAPVA
jgi:BlaI family penicillinase repressor